MAVHNVVDPASVGMSAERLERIAPAMQAFVDRGVVRGISTLVARRGQVVHRGLYGHRDAEAAAAMTDDTIFRIYSMTKPIVSTGLMLLHEEGRFRLDQPVATFLPAFAAPKVMNADGSIVDAAAPITVGDLLGHTSGLTYDFMVDNPAAQLYRDHRVMARCDPHAGGVRRPDRFTAPRVPARRAVPLLGRNRRRRSAHRGDRRSGSRGLPRRARIFGPIGMTDTAFGVPDQQRTPTCCDVRPAGSRGPELQTPTTWSRRTWPVSTNASTSRPPTRRRRRTCSSEADTACSRRSTTTSASRRRSPTAESSTATGSSAARRSS